MDDAVIACIRRDMRTCRVSYNEDDALLIIHQATGELFVSGCSHLQVFHLSPTQLQHIACDALYNALCIARNVDGYITKNDPLDGFAEWCDAIDTRDGGANKAQKALIEWREGCKVWDGLEAFLGKGRLMAYFKLFDDNGELCVQPAEKDTEGEST